jgi:site-specific DNA recombinase
MKAVLYARVSSEEQVDNWSLSAQKREFTEFCQKKGWHVAGIFYEEGISAHTDSIESRPQFMRIL